MFGKFECWRFIREKVSQQAKCQLKKLAGAAFHFGLKANFSAVLKAIYQTLLLIF